MVTKKSNLFVVGIGASAGGLDAIQRLFDHLPDDTGMAFVIIQHLSPDFVSLMPELLAKHTGMKIFTAEENQTIKPNCIYLNQRNKNLHIKGQQLFLLDQGPKHNLNLPIDIFFHTLGEEFKEKSIAIVLSGTGSDGSKGIKTIKEVGGVVMVQDPATAQFDGMPNNSIATKEVDFILDPEALAIRISNLPKAGISITSETNQKSNESMITAILAEIYRHSGIDFREYKKNTLIRRIEKRMNINNLDKLYDYHTFLKSNENERTALKQDFLIGVTQFFRDEKAFSIMRNKVIPAICNSKKPNETIRVWCAGCSTGEEVYSIAMLIDSYIQAHKLNLDFKIFATDVNNIAIDTASEGSFHINTINEIYVEDLEQYFIKEGDKIQIIKRIRGKIVFSAHNLFADPPFIKQDLVTCRNLLIYLDNKVQMKIVQRFIFALNKLGYLFLGSSETLGDHANKFKTIDSKWKIYQNVSDEPILKEYSKIEERVSSLNFKTQTSEFPRREFQRTKNPEERFNKFLLKRFAPDAIIIDKNFNILFVSGDAGKRLSHKPGIYNSNLLSSLDSKTALSIRNGVRQLEKENKEIIIKDVVNQTAESNYLFDISIQKSKENDEIGEAYILQFSIDIKTEEEALIIKDIPLDQISRQHHEELEEELAATKTELQNLVQELETSNEELQSSNEELMASNEELQSTIEELQSVNEELYTVNSEFQNKNLELQQLNNDVNNLLNSTDIGTLFLDSTLLIRKFTPTLQKLFSLSEADQGRPISSFASNFKDLEQEIIMNACKEVLKNLNPIEEEVTANDGNVFLMRIIPFITSDKQIDGVVVTFVNISDLKNIQNKLRTSKKLYQVLFNSMSEGFIHGKIITDKKGVPIDWEYINVNKAFEKHTGLKAKNVIGERATKVFPGIKKDKTDWIKIYGDTAITGKEQFLEEESADLNKVYSSNIFCPQEGEFAATFNDITIEKKKNEELLIAKEKAEKADRLKSSFLANMSHEIRTPLSAIIGFSKFLNNDLEAPDKELYLDQIQNNSEQLLSLVNDLLNISKIESGEIQLNYRTVKIQDLVKKIYDQHYNQIKTENEHKKIKLVLNAPNPEPDPTNVDEVRLKEILHNLITNAIKFTKTGTIELGYTHNSNEIAFYVKDEGIGMAEDQLESIFNRFIQVDGTSEVYGGTGLGLAICRGLVTKMGGKIWAESKVNVGSIFKFTIPKIAAKPIKDEENGFKKMNIVSQPVKKVLIADDSASVRLLYKTILKKHKVDAIFAKNGREAIDFYQQNIDKIDLVLMDIRMPGIDGIEAMKQIKKINPDIPVIAQTAFAMDAEQERFIKEGFVTCLTKPIPENELLSILRVGDLSGNLLAK